MGGHAATQDIERVRVVSTPHDVLLTKGGVAQPRFGRGFRSKSVRSGGVQRVWNGGESHLQRVPDGHYEERPPLLGEALVSSEAPCGVSFEPCALEPWSRIFRGVRALPQFRAEIYSTRKS